MSKNLKPELVQDKYLELLESSNIALHQKLRNQKIKYLIFALFSISALVITFFSFQNKTTTDIFKGHLQQVTFSKDKLLLQSELGNYYDLQTVNNIKWLASNGLFVQINSKIIIFSATRDLQEDEIKRYKLFIPKDKTFTLQLSDNTEILLNSDTQISFLNSRKTSQNHVELLGEAFFKVSKNPVLPFKIKASDMKVAVYGTEFNINNYKENEYVQVALLNGSVKVGVENESKFISPGQKARVYRHQKKMEISKASLSLIMNWTTNQQYFRAEKLETIIKRIENWYHVQFAFENSKIKKLRFTGIINKNDGLLHFLKNLQYTEGINFIIEKNTITLTKNIN